MESLILNWRNPLNKVFTILNSCLEKTPSWLLISIPLALIYLSFVPKSNEEQYLQLAKQYANPNWILDSQNLNEFAGTRVIYQLVLGNVLQYFSLEFVVFTFRFILILLFSQVLVRLYKILGLDKYQIVFHLLLFTVVIGQSFFAGSWIFLSVEPKCFAYLAVFWSIVFFFERRILLSVVALIVATYFHILVGGYSFAYLLLTLLLFKKDHALTIKKIGLGALAYLICIAPFILYLKSGSLDTEITNSSVSPDWIYTYFRAPHHTALVKSFTFFFQNHLSGIINAVIGLALSIIFYPATKNDKVKTINQFVIVSLSGVLLLVSLAFVDKTGVILKFYLYRINTLSVFFFSLLIPIWAYEIIKRDYLSGFRTIIPIAFLLLIISPLTENLYKSVIYRSTNKDLDHICEYIREHTDRSSLILSFIEDPRITRKAERNRLAVYKFVPAQINKISDWYEKYLDRERAINNPDALQEVIEKYGVTHFITSNTQKIDGDYRVLLENQSFSLYEIRKSL